jgi:RNA methyltransferase, TrmH family
MWLENFAMISSTSNTKIKALRSLQSKSRARQESGLFVVEGVRMVEEALYSGWQIRQAFYTDDLNEREGTALNQLAIRGVEIELVAPHVLKTASDTQSPQKMLAVIALQRLPAPDHLDFGLILDALQNPGNLGTIIRTSVAGGVDIIILAPGCADPFAPKVLRAGMGAHFRLPLLSLSWPEIRALVEQQHLLHTYLADPEARLAYTQANFRTPCALIVGGEAHGGGNEAVSLAQSRVRIPMLAGVESLNAAIAAAVLIFEVARQRFEGEN